MLFRSPHIAFGAVSCWHHAHLHSDALNVAGAAYVGIPAVMIGRNEHVAWGITNNICSQRDLYLERTEPGNPDAFLYDGSWEPAISRVEEIKVRGQHVVRKTIRHSRNGPIVDEVLPEAATGTGPVSLRWIGATTCGWFPACKLRTELVRLLTSEKLCGHGLRPLSLLSSLTSTGMLGTRPPVGFLSVAGKNVAIVMGGIPRISGEV